jgi:hypothetical protein
MIRIMGTNMPRPPPGEAPSAASRGRKVMVFSWIELFVTKKDA